MSSSFDAARASGYDERIVRMVPGYEVMHRLTEVCLGTEIRPEAEVLMIGAGTGAEILACGARHPRWAFTAVDPSADMLKLGRERVAAAQLTNTVHWHTGPLATLETETLFDAATLLLVLHFIPEGEKLDLLCEISDRLKPGAPLVLASFTGDPEVTRSKKMYELSRAWAVANGVPPEEAAEKISLTRKDVYMVPDETIKNFFRDAGYIDVQRIFQGLALTMWIARTQRRSVK